VIGQGGVEVGQARDGGLEHGHALVAVGERRRDRRGDDSLADAGVRGRHEQAAERLLVGR
jgi:hypothetical protein